MGIVWLQISQVFPIRWVLLHFPVLREIDGETHVFSYDEVYHRMGILWGKITHTMRKVWVPISQVNPIRWILLHFPVLWEIDGKTHVFLIWWSIPWDASLIGKKHLYYGISMCINFPNFPPTMSFVAFFRTVGNW